MPGPIGQLRRELREWLQGSRLTQRARGNRISGAVAWWFTVDADSITGTPVRKAFARDEANRIFNTMFDVNPCINITSSGAVINTCP